MEAFALYLLKSVIWLTAFALVYFLFLKNERFFELNRLFLLSGVVAAMVFPLITFRYSVLISPTVPIQSMAEVSGAVQVSQAATGGVDLGLILIYLYVLGFLFVAFLIIKQGCSLLKVIRSSSSIPVDKVRLIRADGYESAFSFFSYVFVNPSITEIEMKEIMNHEMVHVRQKHWLDLMLTQLLCVIQWFNPVIWIYLRLVRQNHEYIADKVALQRTSDPAIYRAALLNQIVGAPVISLVNSFSYSLNKKRFTMMETIFSPPYRKLKILFILPVLAIVFFAFAKPDYNYSALTNNQGTQGPATQSSEKEVKGTIVTKDGTPLQGATIIVAQTTIGTITDAGGNFLLKDFPEKNPLVVSYVGFKSKVIKPDFTKEMRIEMVTDTLSCLDSPVGMPPPPPPPPPANEGKLKITGDGPPPLIVVDGVVSKAGLDAIDPETIESMNVLKDEHATNKYGEKGKNGVIEIATKKDSSPSAMKKKSNEEPLKPVTVTSRSDEGTFVVVEELPEFPGGGVALRSWINSNLKYPGDAVKKNITGMVDVGFIVSSNGKIKDVKVIKPVNPLLDAEAVRVVSGMPDWKPGSQHGKKVDVQMKVAVEFKLQ